MLKLENAKGDEKQFWLGRLETLDEELRLLYLKLSTGSGMLEVRVCMTVNMGMPGARFLHVLLSFCAARSLPPTFEFAN
jgi:hypothetical protein